MPNKRNMTVSLFYLYPNVSNLKVCTTGLVQWFYDGAVASWGLQNLPWGGSDQSEVRWECEAEATAGGLHWWPQTWVEAGRLPRQGSQGYCCSCWMSARRGKSRKYKFLVYWGNDFHKYNVDKDFLWKFNQWLIGLFLDTSPGISIWLLSLLQNIKIRMTENNVCSTHRRY